QPPNSAPAAWPRKRPTRRTPLPTFSAVEPETIAGPACCAGAARTPSSSSSGLGGRVTPGDGRVVVVVRGAVVGVEVGGGATAGPTAGAGAGAAGAPGAAGAAAVVGPGLGFGVQFTSTGRQTTSPIGIPSG